MKKIIFICFLFCISSVYCVTGVFDDVPRNHWAYDAVAELYNEGIIVGFPENGQYRGDRPLTRYEIAMMLKNLLNKNLEKPNYQSKNLELMESLILEFGSDLEVIHSTLMTLGSKIESVSLVSEKAREETYKGIQKVFNLEKKLTRMERKNRSWMLFSSVLIAILAGKIY